MAEAGNNVYAERTCGILGTLATIYRQRSEIAAAERVLEMEGQILPLYKRHAFEVGGAQGLQCHAGICFCMFCLCCMYRENMIQDMSYAGLEYKYNMIRYNLYHQTGRIDLAAQVFRDLAADEIRNDYAFDDQNFAYLIPAFLHKDPTMATLDSLSSAQAHILKSVGYDWPVRFLWQVYKDAIC